MNPFENEKGGMIVTDRTYSFLETAGKWARFLAILGFIGLGITLLAGLIMMVGGSIFESNMSRFGRGFRGTGAPFWLMGLMYIAMSVVMFFPLKFLSTFASRAIEIGMRREAMVLEEAIENLKSFFKFQGIIMIIYLGLVALMFFFAIIAAVVR